MRGAGGARLDDTEDSSDEELVYCSEDNMDLIGRKRKHKLLRENNRHSRIGFRSFLYQMFNLSRLTTPTPTSAHVAKTMGLLAAKLAISLAGIIALGFERGHGLDADGHVTRTWMFPLIFMPSMISLCLLSVSMQPVTEEVLNFKVPLVPLLPVVSIFINSYLMMKLSAVTWIRFGVWMLIGLLIYAFYGWRNSSEEYRRNGLVPPNEIQERTSKTKLRKDQL